MSASAKKVTPLELFVSSFLRTHRRSAIGIAELQDALTLIRKKLGIICCDGNPVQLHRRVHGQFTLMVEQLLKQTTKKNNKKSLQRAERQIDLFVNGCCATTVQVNFLEGGSPAGNAIDTTYNQFRAYDSVTGKLVFETVLGGDLIQIFALQKMYFTDRALKYCINTISAPPSGDHCEPTVTNFDQSITLVDNTSGTLGEVCGSSAIVDDSATFNVNINVCDR